MVISGEVKLLNHEINALVREQFKQSSVTRQREINRLKQARKRMQASEHRGVEDANWIKLREVAQSGNLRKYWALISDAEWTLYISQLYAPNPMAGPNVRASPAASHVPPCKETVLY